MRLRLASALVLLSVVSVIAQNPAPPAAGQPAAAGQAPAQGAGSTIGLRMRAVAAQPDTPGIGPYPAMKEMAPGGLEFAIYRPRDLNALGTRKLGVHVWGNGGCSFDGGFARFHLMDIASYGYVSLAPGLLSGGGGLPAAGAPRATAERMLAALDWILAENARQGSPYYQRIDTTRIAASGNSCGGLLALRVGQDPRVKTVILQNSGVMPDRPNTAPLGGVSKADLAKLHTSVLYVLGGASDIAQANGLDDFNRINHVPVFVADKKNADHFGVFIEPNGRGTEIEIDWLLWQLEGNAVAGRTFLGEDCRLCNAPGWTVHRKRIE